MCFLDAADVNAVSLQELLKVLFFVSHSLRVPMHKGEVASRITPSFPGDLRRMGAASRWGWAPLRLGARHRFYLAVLHGAGCGEAFYWQERLTRSALLSRCPKGDGASQR